MSLRPSLPFALRALALLAHLFPFLLCFLLLSAAFAREPPEACEAQSAWGGLRASDDFAAIREAAARVPNGEGRLFRVTREGAPPSFLFGTMHLSDPRVLALPPSAEAAFAASPHVVVETVDVLDPARMAGALLARPDLTMLPAGRRLGDVLGAEDTGELRAALDRRGVPFASVETLQPWFVAASLALSPCEAARLAGGAEVLDVALARRAEREGKALAGLESAAEQMEALASLPLDLQAEALRASLETLDRVPVATETMIELYLAGLVSTIEPAIERLAPEGSETEAALRIAQNFEERVIRRRNAVMTERLGPLLGEGGRFVAVGALHLPGETGLVEALRREGWQVERAD